MVHHIQDHILKGIDLVWNDSAHLCQVILLSSITGGGGYMGLGGTMMPTTSLCYPPPPALPPLSAHVQPWHQKQLHSEPYQDKDKKDGQYSGVQCASPGSAVTSPAETVGSCHTAAGFQAGENALA